MKKIAVLLVIICAFIVSNAQISADFTWAGNQCGNSTIVFTDASSGEGIDNWVWSVNGIEEYSGSSVFSYTFPDVETETVFEITLFIISSSFSLEDEITKQISVNSPPSPYAGEDFAVCGLVADLEAFFSLPGTTGLWSGPGSFSAPNSENTEVSVSESGEYTFTFRESVGDCYSEDQVTVTFIQEPSPSIIPAIDTVCGLEYELNVSNVQEDGMWSAYSNGELINPLFINGNNSPNTEVIIPNYQGIYAEVNFIWTESVQLMGIQCSGSASQDVIFAREPLASVGPNNVAEICGNEFTFNADTTGYGWATGTWISSDIISTFDDANDPNATVTIDDLGSFGDSAHVTGSFSWVVQNFICTSVDTMWLTFYEKPIAYAGENNAACGNDINLNAVFSLSESENYTPSGIWSISSKPNAEALADFENINHNITEVIVSHNGLWEFEFREYNSISTSCYDADTVIIEFVEIPIIDAGEDKYACGFCTELEAINAGFSGSWIPNGASFDDYLNPNTVVCVNNYGSIDFVWTESNTATASSISCTTSDTVNITFSEEVFIEETYVMCEGDSYLWHGDIYTEAGVYYVEYITQYGCDSIIQLDLSVNPSPTSVTVSQTPSDGVLTQGNTGTITLATSYVNTDYWVTMGGTVFTDEISGTGDNISLGDNYSGGSFDIWSRNEFDCELLQGNVNFVESSGTNKIAANITFGTPTANFPSGHARVLLYREVTDINNNTVIIQVAEQVLGSNGQAEFNDLEPGNYYLGSFIIYPDNYNVAEHVYYQTAVMHEDAISIPIDSETIFIASLHHTQLIENPGSNNGGGTVGTSDDKKGLNPLSDMVVILRDVDASAIIDVSTTDEDGNYFFENIPDNTNVQIFVTSLLHQDWLPYDLETDSDQFYNINFIVEGSSIYPEGTVGVSSLEISSIDFSIYPNPAKDILQISSNIENAKISIYDISGKLVYTDMFFVHREINISNFSAGPYLIVLTKENGEAGIQKFIKE